MIPRWLRRRLRDGDRKKSRPGVYPSKRGKRQGRGPSVSSRFGHSHLNWLRDGCDDGDEVVTWRLSVPAGFWGDFRESSNMARNGVDGCDKEVLL